MKKALMGAWGAEAKIRLSLAVIRYSDPPLVCYAPGAEMFLGGSTILPLMKIFQPLPPNKKNAGHASENSPVNEKKMMTIEVCNTVTE